MFYFAWRRISNFKYYQVQSYVDRCWSTLWKISWKKLSKFGLHFLFVRSCCIFEQSCFFIFQNHRKKKKNSKKDIHGEDAVSLTYVSNKCLLFYTEKCEITYGTIQWQLARKSILRYFQLSARGKIWERRTQLWIFPDCRQRVSIVFERFSFWWKQRFENKDRGELFGTPNFSRLQTESLDRIWKIQFSAKTKIWEQRLWRTLWNSEFCFPWLEFCKSWTLIFPTYRGTEASRNAFRGFSRWMQALSAPDPEWSSAIINRCWCSTHRLRISFQLIGFMAVTTPSTVEQLRRTSGSAPFCGQKSHRFINTVR